jgi:EAL domain-containing protein (putative c-di-GMP-specific phosphodiesterase class I)/DNA-binding NarL/FixJ family response regulator
VTDRTLVLVVDDDPASRALVQHALEGEGFDTVLAANGREALERIAELAIDIVLMDVSMPVLGGLEALREIRGNDRSRRLPVILVTGSAGEADRVKGLESGADDYLAKPIAVRELAARVRAQLRSRTAWTHELERGRAVRRKLASVVENLRTDVPLLALATNLADQLPAALDLDGVAVLHIGRDAVRTIASSGALQWRFQPSRELPPLVGAEIASRAASGVWLEAGEIRSGRRVRTIDIAFVPYRLGSSPEPLGCLAFGLQPGGSAGPLSHRLPDLIDATDFIVAVLRPAVEEAETAGAAIDRIRRIVSDQEFTILLQPIFRLDGRTIIAVEALTRFASGLPPDTQFAEAAAYGLGRTMERAAAAAALAAVASLPKHVALSVNLSADVLQHEPTLPALFASTDRAIIVELTEHERIDDYVAVRSALGRLGPNVKLAIDDAGSGFASLRHIFALEPAYVKLDIEWVRGIESDPVRRALVSGLVYFASETGCELIAEGIETDAEVGALRDLGIQLGQGYLLGLPEPADA